MISKLTEKAYAIWKRLNKRALTVIGVTVVEAIHVYLSIKYHMKVDAGYNTHIADTILVWVLSFIVVGFILLVIFLCIWGATSIIKWVDEWEPDKE